MTTGTILIGGPTASGKSGLALALAEALEDSIGATIINADSMQVYSELRIVTARPTPEDEARAPHELYGVMTGAQACSAGHWRRMALERIEAANQAGRVPIVVGGTGLYLKALTEGLADIPEIPPEVRDAARSRMEAIGAAAFHGELAKVDPQAAARLAPGDSQRLIRAWEVWQATGESLIDWQKRINPEDRLAGPAAKVVLMPTREEVYARADARVTAMVAAGALEEVRALDDLGLPSDLPIQRAVGVPEFRAAVRGEMALREATERAQQSSRRFAKRQYTWFRHQAPDWTVFTSDILVDNFAQQSERIFLEVFPIIRQFLLTAES